MYLHEDKDLFVQAINLASQRFGYVQDIIEKDYYVTELLRLIAASGNQLIFKGGTSLSKCYGLINRFSEDIDLACGSSLTQGNRKKVKSCLLSCFKALGLAVQNGADVRSKRDFNRYEASYISLFSPESSALKPAVFVETYFAINAFPFKAMPLTSFVGQIFEAEAPDLTDKYGLTPFNMQVQSIERTFADKLFAICDYYLQGATERHSRHLYDIFKLLPNISLDESFRSLFVTVRKSRIPLAFALSAKEDINLRDTLSAIIVSDAYREDYENITRRLLVDDVSYDMALSALVTLLDTDILSI